MTGLGLIPDIIAVYCFLFIVCNGIEFIARILEEKDTDDPRD